MEYNAFDLTAKLNYKTSLLARIKLWFKRRKFIKERAQKGWSRYDAWDFDSYLAMIIGDALEYLADSHMSHPWGYTPSEWDEKLIYISKCFKQYNEEPETPAYDAWEEARRGGVDSDKLEELALAWKKEEVTQHEQKMKRLKEGFELLYEVYPDLWD